MRDWRRGKVTAYKLPVLHTQLTCVLILSENRSVSIADSLLIDVYTTLLSLCSRFCVNASDTGFIT